MPPLVRRYIKTACNMWTRVRAPSTTEIKRLGLSQARCRHERYLTNLREAPLRRAKGSGARTPHWGAATPSPDGLGGPNLAEVKVVSGNAPLAWILLDPHTKAQSR